MSTLLRAAHAARSPFAAASRQCAPRATILCLAPSQRAATFPCQHAHHQHQHHASSMSSMHHVSHGHASVTCAAAAAPGAASATTKRVLVPIANGTEEMEAIIVIDVLRRAGAEVVVASVEPQLEVTCSRGVKVVADVLIDAAAQQSFDLVALPGGMPGAERLRDSAPLEALLRAQREQRKPYAAICATPAVFLEAKGLIGQGQRATAHPAFSGKLRDQSAVEQRVVVDGLLTTSRGPGTAFEFALKLVEQLFGEEKAKAVAGPMVMYAH